MRRLLLVDGQVFQSPAWHRGMGKYSFELLKSISKLGDSAELDMRIILSSKLTSETGMLKELKDQLPKAEIVFLNLIPNEIGNTTVATKNRITIDDYVSSCASEYDSVSFLILSIMQGEICPVFPSSQSVKKLVVLYDLIPLMFHDVYLRNPITRMEYLTKIGELLRADDYLAISKTVANDLSIYLGISPTRVVSIDGGPIAHSYETKPVDISHPFVLMPTGNDLRKNNRRGVIGFQEFNEKHDNKYRLVITSFFKEHEIIELKKLSEHAVFSGNVSGEELNYLYEKSEALLFPPEYEGLGLPILEAVERNKSIACSNIAVFREMSATAFAYFDPLSTHEIAQAIEQAVLSPSIDRQAYKAILEKYTWKNTAKKTLELLVTPNASISNQPKQTIAMFGVDPSSADSAKLMINNHAELSRLANVDYYIVPVAGIAERRINFLPYITACTYIAPGFKFNYDQYDSVVYHIANEADYAQTLFMALAYPGVIVLHDESLDVVWSAMRDRVLIDGTRFELEQAIDASLGADSCLGSLLATSRAVFIHKPITKKVIKRYSDALHLNIPVEINLMPISPLAYPGALPEKTVPIRDANDFLQTSTDFSNNIERSKLQFVFAGARCSEQTILEFMGLGVVPVLGPKQQFRLPPDLAPTRASIEAFELASLSQPYEIMSTTAVAYVTTNNSQISYATKLLTAGVRGRE